MIRTWHNTILILALTGLFNGNVGAVTLDRQGTAPPPPFYTCHNSFELEKAGGKPYFKIHIEAWCGVHPADGVPGWTPVDWKRITVLADYNYDTGAVEEVVWLGPDELLRVNMHCQSNPWAHVPQCSLTQPVVNNTHAVVNGPFPLSAHRIPHSMRTAIANWEQTPSTESLLADWNPMGAEQPAADMKIASPTAMPRQIFPEDASGLELDVSTLNGSTVGLPLNIEIEWHQLEETPVVVGDIAMPSDKTHWWQPLSFAAPTSVGQDEFPMPLSSYFAGKPGHYKVRVRGKFVNEDWSSEVKFQVGDPGFELPPSEQQIISAGKALELVISSLQSNAGNGDQQQLQPARGLFSAKAKQTNQALPIPATPTGNPTPSVGASTRERQSVLLRKPSSGPAANPQIGAASSNPSEATAGLAPKVMIRMPVPPAGRPGTAGAVSKAGPRGLAAQATLTPARFAITGTETTGAVHPNRPFTLKVEVQNTGQVAGAIKDLEVHCAGCQIKRLGEPGALAPGAKATIVYAITPSHMGRQSAQVSLAGAIKQVPFRAAVRTVPQAAPTMSRPAPSSNAPAANPPQTLRVRPKIQIGQ
ncbi:MAG: hypothetical protein OEQ18_03500 [Gammaproteobacteria bacterium]|nr:hypothetical protein [Gammaproteobacteria bacterium]